jgi:hypothetical protein
MVNYGRGGGLAVMVIMSQDGEKKQRRTRDQITQVQCPTWLACFLGGWIVLRRLIFLLCTTKLN